VEPLAPRLRFDLTPDEDGALAGFSISEQANGVRFRWTGPVALIESSLPPGSYNVVIDLLPMRTPEGLGLVATLNGRRLDPKTYRVAADRISIPTDVARSRRDCDWFGFACNTFRPRKSGQPDERQLGLAVRSITFERQ
jgi:hypothetical protein